MPDDKHLVRPRWVWGGSLIALIGGFTIAAGMVIGVLPVTIVGIVLLIVGGVIAARGGILYDTNSTESFHEEVEQVRHDDAHPGTAPGDMEDSPEARREAENTQRRLRGLPRR